MFWDVEANSRLAAHECDLDDGSLNKNSQKLFVHRQIGAGICAGDTDEAVATG